MNIYVVGEGDVAEKQVYEKWIPFVNPNLSYVDSIFDITDNHFSIISGGGYPNYKDVVKYAIEDVNKHGNIDRLVIAIDSEEMSYDEKYDEIVKHTKQFHCKADIHTVIQHFCIETWALGNRKVFSSRPQCRTLIEYKKIYDVKDNDPEMLPALRQEELNRAQFAEKYLRRIFQDKYKRLTYSKLNRKANQFGIQSC